ncbi:riboflavin synthase [Helicobacter fennelliae]|uniref:Riboflavin synthase n=2 Tax=Helicobacter fennelliae TaxID=215 RepID=T1D034_9HELI|nr:riboflavin synthase [Helicobacter fennelliae]GAD19540.1 riboflavin synthase eubacterial/eukaryotic [Helicobacter fennelliae MRY12-0050]SQB98483.1 riboflavin synthase subunit alpha [Helicobacter fennelliae]STP07846.1 riboflavin synthase subunit alpha [Helicobacter fennelliae]STQ84269.1 riboflavin synthase subunit alpha [Helicobacter fennelliae]
MFSGLIREIAKVRALQNNILSLDCSYTPEIGDSIAVNGMCLTVIALDSQGFCLEISKHSSQKVAIENYQGMVHIEPALLANSRLDGHFVQGHIDAIGTIKSIKKHVNQIHFEILAPKQTLLLAIPQGSITIDGVSLTISDVRDESFFLTIIPHTFNHTLFHTYTIGRRVNIETDMIVRSVAHILSKKESLQANPNVPHSTTNIAKWSEIDEILMRY